MATDKSDSPFIWVLSNRKDDRVVLFERDPAHPNGEAFVGGAGPAKVARTGTVENLLRDGLLVEIPEPPEGRKKPVDQGDYQEPIPSAQPGQAIKLGRAMDPELVPEAAQKAVQKQQDAAPEQIASEAKMAAADTK